MTAARRTLAVGSESFPTRGTFAISRGSRTRVEVVTCTIRQGRAAGRGECVPYARYDETVASVIERIEAVRDDIERGISRAALRERMPAGAARNALDCALLDLEAKRQARPAWAIAGLDAPVAAVTAFTIGLGRPAEMAARARAAAGRPLLKLKLGGDGDAERVAAVREAVPGARLIVDANEAWTPAQLEAGLADMARLGVELVEQPLPADADEALAAMARPLAVCADESCRSRDGLAALAARYDMINVKLDKSGGLTEAIDLARAARALGLKVMVGCMVATSLAMAPAVLLAGLADYVDLDGPLLLARDREPALRYRGAMVQPPPPELWG